MSPRMIWTSIEAYCPCDCMVAQWHPSIYNRPVATCLTAFKRRLHEGISMSHLHFTSHPVDMASNYTYVDEGQAGIPDKILQQPPPKLSFHMTVKSTDLDEMASSFLPCVSFEHALAERQRVMPVDKSSIGIMEVTRHIPASPHMNIFGSLSSPQLPFSRTHPRMDQTRPDPHLTQTEHSMISAALPSRRSEIDVVMQSLCTEVFVRKRLIERR